MKRSQTLLLIVVLALAVPVLAGPPINGQPDHNSVYNYAINWAVQTGATEITVEAQARYCSACNPNPSGNPGCAPFTHTGWCGGATDGTYIAVRIKDSEGTILSLQKRILQHGVNMMLDQVCTWQFIFSSLPLAAGDIVTVEADTYCSWCGHYYPSPVTLSVYASDSSTTYTGDTSGLVGTTAFVCAALMESEEPYAPLVDKEITFTLEGLDPVSAITDENGVAFATLQIPAGMAAGTYPMCARFAGDAEYFPSSDTVPFQVIVMIPIAIDIHPGSYPNPINTRKEGTIPVAILGSAGFDVTKIDPASLRLEGAPLATRGQGSLQYSFEDVSGDFTSTLEGKPDGYPDLVGHFPANQANWWAGMETATITGNLRPEYGGIPIEGSDSIKLLLK